MKTKTTTAAADPAAYHKLRDLIADIDVAMVTIVTPQGALHSRPMFTRAIEEDGRVWFITSEHAGAAGDLTTGQAVCLSYADPKKRQFVSVSGKGSLVRDAAKAAELWDAALKTYLPRGKDDPDLALLCVRIESAEYWDAVAGRMVALPASRSEPEHAKVEVRATPASG